MGLTLSKDEEEKDFHPLNFEPSQEPNPPEFHLSKFFNNGDNITQSQIMNQYLHSSLFKDSKSEEQSKERLNTNTTTESENEHFDINNTDILLNSSTLINQYENDASISVYTEEESIDESPLKTMAGSLLKDIRHIYKFQKILGEGHFGSVRAGFHRLEPSPHRLYAIKSINKKHLRNKDIEALTKEVDIISSLDHPNIIKFYETYHDEFYFHIVMELCRGKDLQQRLIDNKGYISEKKVAMVILKVLHAISYCHSRGITHRDLKPENILFDSSAQDSEIKLIDFGLSRKYSLHEKMHTILGTPYYVAPEVLRGSYDEKCDIWSIGALTFFMLCGEPPFKGKSNNDLFKKIIKEEVKFDNSKWRNVSPEAIKFIKMCLNKNPENRPSAIDAIKSKWFNLLLTKVHENIYVNKEMLMRIKSYIPCCKFKKYVLKFFINMMSHSEINQYKTMFYAVDLEHDGKIDQNELEKAFRMGEIEISKEEIRRILSASDDVNKHSLDYSEFIIVSLNLKKLLTMEKIKSAFNYFDINNSGLIEANDIENALLRFGKKIINEEDVFKMIKEVSHKDKKDISFYEFINLFPFCLNKAVQI